jgi:hypothetical protein
LPAGHNAAAPLDERVGVGDFDGVALADRLPVGVAVTVAVTPPARVGDVDCVAVAVALEPPAPGERVSEGVADGVGVLEGDRVLEGVCERVAHGVRDAAVTVPSNCHAEFM